MNVIDWSSGARVVRAAKSSDTPSASSVLSNWRLTATCSPAQMRLALLASGQLSDVQLIADSDPAASIIWEYATQINRNSQFIDALRGDTFDDLEIDAMFVSAMAVVI